MKLPNREHAYVAQEKLNAYLLSETHAVGRSKAIFFRNLGFDETRVEILKNALLYIAQYEEVKGIIPSIHGTKYIVDGNIKSSIKKTVKIRTIWIIEMNQDIPRFVTAYPV